MKTDFLNRNVNEGFSGGERKRNEILQLAVSFRTFQCCLDIADFILIGTNVPHISIPSDMVHIICVFIL